MTISFSTGGARSGKSLSAKKRTLCFGLQAVYIATSEILEDEMAQRIEGHIVRRGNNWQSLEMPIALTGTIHSLEGGSKKLNAVSANIIGYLYEET